MTQPQEQDPTPKAPEPWYVKLIALGTSLIVLALCFIGTGLAMSIGWDLFRTGWRAGSWID